MRGGDGCPGKDRGSSYMVEKAGKGKVSVEQVQDAIRRLRKDGEELLKRVREEAGRLLSKDSRKAAQDLVDQARKLTTDLQKRAEEAIRRIEKRGQQAIEAIEKEAQKRIEPIASRLNIPSRDEVEKLKKRVSNIEKRLEELAHANRAA